MNKQPTAIDHAAALDRAQVAQELATKHYESEPGITSIMRVLTTPEEEALFSEPIKLLEVNRDTVASGIMPLGFDPEPANGVPFSSVIIEITPEEWTGLQRGALALPHGWTLGPELPRPVLVQNGSR